MDEGLRIVEGALNTATVCLQVGREALGLYERPRDGRGAFGQDGGF